MKNKKLVIIFFVLAVLFLALGIWTTILVKKYEEKQIIPKKNNLKQIIKQETQGAETIKTQTQQEIVHEPPEGAVSAN